MLVDRVIINASPLIVFFNSEQEDLLPQLFSEIIVPRAVIEEVIQGKTIAPLNRSLKRIGSNNKRLRIILLLRLGIWVKGKPV
jgi:predicted nucleic acid-binding protein